MRSLQQQPCIHSSRIHAFIAAAAMQQQSRIHAFIAAAAMHS